MAHVALSHRSDEISRHVNDGHGFSQQVCDLDGVAGRYGTMPTVRQQHDSNVPCLESLAWNVPGEHNDFVLGDPLVHVVCPSIRRRPG
jgi:hypothetical protein